MQSQMYLLSAQRPKCSSVYNPCPSNTPRVMPGIACTPAAQADCEALLPSSGSACQSPAPPAALGFCQGSDSLSKHRFEHFCCVLNSTASPFYSGVAGLNFQGLLFQICLMGFLNPVTSNFLLWSPSAEDSMPTL